ncbi:hypothetical protein ACFL00_05285 [Pseudomonadota bacterium]
MMNTDLKQTVFHIEKLQNVVNVGRSSAYQIFTYSGPAIGRIARIEIPEGQRPANDATFNAAKTLQRPANWFQRILSAFRR